MLKNEVFAFTALGIAVASFIGVIIALWHIDHYKPQIEELHEKTDKTIVVTLTNANSALKNAQANSVLAEAVGSNTERFLEVATLSDMENVMYWEVFYGYFQAFIQELIELFKHNNMISPYAEGFQSW